MDISKGGAGMFLNFVPAFIDAEESPFDLSVLPESLFEGQSAAITLTLKNPGSSPEKYEFSWSDNSAAPSLSPTNHSYTISDRTANLTVIPIDDDCLEDTMSIQAKRVSDSKIFTFEFRIQEVDRCIFLASNALPDMQGPGYSGNLGGIGGADLRCRNEKPPALPGGTFRVQSPFGDRRRKKSDKYRYFGKRLADKDRNPLFFLFDFRSGRGMDCDRCE
nr:hypothetical protein CH379_00910 [Leptospira ellisii]